MDVETAMGLARQLIDQVGEVLRGKEDVIELATLTFFARGHLLLEDVPGVGKTTLARAFAASVGLEFRRVQFTSDLMPADVVGGNIYERETGAFKFVPGPIFTQVMLADEINRTTPRTQSALLEAMGEGQVSIDGTTHVLPSPFFVIATQNPQDFYGTYPLPESQLDRFLVRSRIGYPSPAEERAILLKGSPAAGSLAPLADPATLCAAQDVCETISVPEPVLDYLHNIVLRTRDHALIEMGASTRAVIAFLSAVRARALVKGRAFATPDDVKALAIPVLAHRIRPRGASHESGQREQAELVLRELMEQLPVPL